jgi:hypothetical protein
MAQLLVWENLTADGLGGLTPATAAAARGERPQIAVHLNYAALQAAGLVAYRQKQKLCHCVLSSKLPHHEICMAHISVTHSSSHESQYAMLCCT